MEQEFNSNTFVESNNGSSSALNGNLGDKITTAIKQDASGNKVYFAEKINELQKRQTKIISRVFMSGNDKSLLKTSAEAESKMLKLVTDSDYNLYEVHCDALLDISKNFHGSLTQSLKGNFDLSKGNSLMASKQRLVTLIEEKTAEFTVIYHRHKKRISDAKNDPLLASFLEKILVSSMSSFISNQNHILNEFDQEFQY